MFMFNLSIRAKQNTCKLTNELAKGRIEFGSLNESYF